VVPRADPSVEGCFDHRTAVQFEVRWFIPGRLPKAIRAGRPRESRTDEYYLPSLARDFALKRRSRGVVERKWLVEPPRPVLVGGRPGLAERWLKERIAASIDLGNPEHWQPIRKSLWQVGEVQVTEISLDDEPWWTLAVRSADDRYSELPRQLSRILKRAAVLPSCSYPAWLLEHRPSSRPMAARAESLQPHGDR
jgi:hypothetical protein